MVRRLDSEVAVITGAAAGIGRETALLFAREGASVVAMDIDAEELDHLGALIRAEGGTAVALCADITKEAEVAQAFSEAKRQLGPAGVLVNCAGGSRVEDSTVTEVDLSVWDATINLDLKGTLLCCREAIPQMLEKGGGSVVNLSSGAALRGSSPAHVYTAAKGAILSLTRAIAGAYAKSGIRANAICAGRIMTERIVARYGTKGSAGTTIDRQDAAGRQVEYPFWIGQPRDIANIALFLASGESRMITGASIPADGGRSAY